jgi:hypothetical protein
MVEKQPNGIIKPERAKICPKTEVVVFSNQLISAKKDNDITRQSAVMENLLTSLQDPMKLQALREMQKDL